MDFRTVSDRRDCPLVRLPADKCATKETPGLAAMQAPFAQSTVRTNADSWQLQTIPDGNAVNRQAPDTTYSPMIAMRVLSWSLLAFLALSPRTDASDLATDGRGGYLVVAEDSNTIRLVSPDGSISVLLEISGDPVEFEDRLTAVAVDAQSRDAYVSDYDEVFRVTSLGTVSVVAGNPNSGDYGIEPSSGRITTDSPLRDVVALAFDPLSDTLFIAEHSGRILALRDDHLRVYASADRTGPGLAGHAVANLRLGPPVRDMELGPDGSLFVLGREHVWRIPPGGDPIHAVGQGLDGTSPRSQFPSLVSLAVWANDLYGGTAHGEIVRIEPDGTLRSFSSASGPAGRFAFTASGALALLTGDANDFAITEIGPDGSFARTLPHRKVADGPPARHIIGGTRVPANDLLAVVVVATASGFCTGSLISPAWVLTAVHCVLDAENNSNGPFRVSACADLSGDCPHREIPVRSVHVHPRYEHRGFIDIQRVPSDWKRPAPVRVATSVAVRRRATPLGATDRRHCDTGRGRFYYGAVGRFQRFPRVPGWLGQHSLQPDRADLSGPQAMDRNFGAPLRRVQVLSRSRIPIPVPRKPPRRSLPSRKRQRRRYAVVESQDLRRLAPSAGETCVVGRQRWSSSSPKSRRDPGATRRTVVLASPTLNFRG